MGQVASSLGDTLGAAAGAFGKSLTTMVGAPKHPLDMPNLGDGRSQDQLRNEAEMMYHMDTKNHINIAFIGLNCESKVALIHSLRLTAECKTVLGIEAPKAVATCYVHCDKSYKHVRFWDITDLPGTFEQRCLFAFDCMVILCGDMIRQGDIDLIKQSNIVSGSAPVVVARSDMDFYVDKHLGLEPNENSIHTGKARQGPIIKDGMKTQLKKGGIDCPAQLESVYLISPPGMLAARAVNFDGTKYIWDEFDFMKAMLDVVSKRRY
jgi:hypothetical protein